VKKYPNENPSTTVFSPSSACAHSNWTDRAHRKEYVVHFLFLFCFVLFSPPPFNKENKNRLIIATFAEIHLLQSLVSFTTTTKWAKEVKKYKR
jgi:hypothetical protein